MFFQRAIILLADGARPDVFEELLKAGNLPNIARYLVEPGTYARAVTAFPSTTGPAHMPFLTGALPATLNVPGIRWFDKQRYASLGHGSMFTLGGHDRWRSYVGVETFRINQDMRRDIRTIFEIVPRSYSIFNSVNRGAGRRNLTRIMRVWYWYYAHLTDRWRFVDCEALRKVLKAMKKDPQFLFVVFPGIDEYSHIADPRHPSVIKEYAIIDDAVGQLANDDTLIWVVSDHGLSQTHTHFCVNEFLESHGIRPFFYPLVYKKGFDAANMMSGNGMTHLYFKGRDGWGGHLTIDEINELYPGLVDDFLNEPAVGVIAARDSNGGIVVMTRKGRARIKLANGGVTYKVSGADPLYQGNQLPAENSATGYWPLVTGHCEYPDAPYQLAHIFTSPRSGDLIISAAPGYDLRLKYENPEHKASHGSLHREHMVVPVAVNVKLEIPPPPPFSSSKGACPPVVWRRSASGGKGGYGGIRTVDVFPTTLKLLGYDVPENIDGVSLGVSS